MSKSEDLAAAYRTEAQSAKLWRKMKEAPFVPLGLAAGVGAVGFGVLQYRNRGSQSTSMYVMRFRVISQGMVVGALTLAVGWNILNTLWDKRKSNGAALEEKSPGTNS